MSGLADLLSNCTFNTSLAAPAVEPYEAGNSTNWEETTPSLSFPENRPAYEKFKQDQVVSSTKDSQIEQLTNLLEQERQKSEQYLSELGSQKEVLIDINSRFDRLEAQKTEQEQTFAMSSRKLEEQAKQGQDCVLQLNILSQKCKETEKQLSLERERSKKLEGTLESLVKLIEETTPGLSDKKPKKISKEDRAVRVLSLLEAEKKAKAKELEDVLEYAKKDVNVLEDYDVAGAVKEVKTKGMQVRDMKVYRKGVEKLGVIVK